MRCVIFKRSHRAILVFLSLAAFFPAYAIESNIGAFVDVEQGQLLEQGEQLLPAPQNVRVSFRDGFGIRLGGERFYGRHANVEWKSVPGASGYTIQYWGNSRSYWTTENISPDKNNFWHPIEGQDQIEAGFQPWAVVWALDSQGRRGAPGYSNSGTTADLSPPSGEFFLLGAIGKAYRVTEYQIDLYEIIEGTTQGVLALRITQEEVDEALEEAGEATCVKASRNDRASVTVWADGNVTFSIGPDYETKIFHVLLKGGVDGEIIGHSTTYGPPAGAHCAN